MLLRNSTKFLSPHSISQHCSDVLTCFKQGDTGYSAPAYVVHAPQELPGNSGGGPGSARSFAVRTPSIRSNEGILPPRQHATRDDIQAAPKHLVELPATDGLSAASRPPA